MAELHLGLYEKFHLILRKDGQSNAGGKHWMCRYFPLDLTHDVHAIPAIRAYAASVGATNALLAEELCAQARHMEQHLLTPPAVCATCGGSGRCLDGATCPCRERS